jgi:hypothetical protein
VLERESNGRERQLQREIEIASTEKREERTYWSERRASVKKKKFLDCFTENRSVKQSTVK